MCEWEIVRGGAQGGKKGGLMVVVKIFSPPAPQCWPTSLAASLEANVPQMPSDATTSAYPGAQ